MAATYQATIVLHFYAEDMEEALATVHQAVDGGVATTNALYEIRTVRREGQERRRSKPGDR